MSVVLALPGPTLDAYFMVFPDLDCVDLSVPGKPYMSNFCNTKEIENPMVGSNVMISESALTRFAWFSGYLNDFNSKLTHE